MFYISFLIKLKSSGLVSIFIQTSYQPQCAISILSALTLSNLYSYSVKVVVVL
ncbi:hypothetical protein GW891_00720 [bacterium]|nr:hypothetical protein [bacterium]